MPPQPGTPAPAPSGSPSGSVFGMDFALDEGGGHQDDDWSDQALSNEATVIEGPPPDQVPQQDQQQAAQPAPGPQPQPQPQPPTQPAQEQPPAPTQQQPAPPAEGVPGEAGQPATSQEQQPSETTRKWLGKYDTPEQMADGLKNIRRLQVRTAEQLNQEQERRTQLETFLQRVAPLIPQDQLRAALQGQAPPQQQQQVQLPTDLSQLTPEQLNDLVQQRVQQGVEQVQQQAQVQQQQAQRDAAGQQVRVVVDSFLGSHPEIEPGSELDYGVNEVMEEFQKDREGNHRPELFPYSLDNLEVALKLTQNDALKNMVVDLDLVPDAETLPIAEEALQNPAFARQLKANPTYLDSDEGVELAREMAQLPSLVTATVQQAQPPSPEMARLAATVETGGQGAPMPNAPAQQLDEFDRDIQAYEAGRAGNIFGLPIDLS